MKKKKYSLSVGIPTYEADESLITTLNHLVKQTKFKNLKSILIAIDGNTNNFESVSKLKKGKIKLYFFKKRKGQSVRINDLFKIAKSDYLLLLNDDVVIGKNTIKEILKEINKNGYDLYGCNISPYKKMNRLQNIFNIGSDIARFIAKHWNKSDNFLSFNGRGIILSKKLYKNVKIPVRLWNNDAFMYFFAKENGYSTGYVSKAKISYLIPANISEHFKQAQKFLNSFNDNKIYFKGNIGNYYKVPPLLKIRAILNTFRLKPITTGGYLFISIFVRLNYKFNKASVRKHYWDTDKSTKLTLSSIKD